MIINLFPTDRSIVERVSVQVSEYSERNGGSDNGTWFIVEVLFPDGKHVWSSYHRSVEDARRAAENEAAARSADLLTVSMWPNREVSEAALCSAPPFEIDVTNKAHLRQIYNQLIEVDRGRKRE